MRNMETSPAWDHGIALAICFFGWIILTLMVEGIRSRAEASHTVSKAFVFTVFMAIVDLGIWAYRDRT